MHMRKFAALNIFISFAICLPVFANSDNWTYSPPGSYEQAISISKETGEIKSHLYLGKIKFCEVDDEFFYFSSDFLKFSVPKFIKGEEMVWEKGRSEEHTSELQSHSDLVCRLLLEKKKKI